MQTIIECSELGQIRDIPAELTQLQKQNTTLQHSNRVFKWVLILIGVGVGAYIINKIVKYHREEKKNGIRRV